MIAAVAVSILRLCRDTACWRRRRHRLPRLRPQLPRRRSRGRAFAIPPLHAFKPTQPKRIELANGLVIFLQEDHELPFVDGTILIRGGSRNEPADEGRPGLALRGGVAHQRHGDRTAAMRWTTELAEKAAGIETDGGLEYTSLEWSGFKQDFDTSSARRSIFCCIRRSRRTSCSWRSAR